MTDMARLHLPKIKTSTRRCVRWSPTRPDLYCTRVLGHTGRHAATEGARRVVEDVWGDQ